MKLTWLNFSRLLLSFDKDNFVCLCYFDLVNKEKFSVSLTILGLGKARGWNLKHYCKPNPGRTSWPVAPSLSFLITDISPPHPSLPPSLSLSIYIYIYILFQFSCLSSLILFCQHLGQVSVMKYFPSAKAILGSSCLGSVFQLTTLKWNRLDRKLYHLRLSWTWRPHHIWTKWALVFFAWLFFP